ncbi:MULTISPECIES: hypothetical protein [unclassified Nonomuraea]|uniref:hypothetical protein n=1 Tax=unclassified Nonomuraea TaxID=2593643 RepID=UPI0033C314CA
MLTSVQSNTEEPDFPADIVEAAEAPRTLARLDERSPNEIRQNNYLTNPVDQEILELFKEAYAEAAHRRSRPNP